MKKILYIMTTLTLLMLANACVKDLDQYPKTDLTAKDVYTGADGYQGVLSGIYAAMIQRIGSISSVGEQQNFYRVLWMIQDASTDAMDAIWLAGQSLTEINDIAWDASNVWTAAMYYHVYNIIGMSNELIRNAEEEDIASFSEEEKERIRIYRNEARFLRAYAYMYAIDFYPKMSFITEKDPVGSFIPAMYDRKQMFGYIESELRDLTALLPAENYAHATSYASWALLARLYLNGETWTGISYADKCIEACQEVLKGNFSLEKDYAKLFNAENHLRTNEIIFALACDGAHTTTWDATTFITCGSVLDNFAEYDKIWGTYESGPWNCHRARPELLYAFEEGDNRNLIIGYDRFSETDYNALSDAEKANFYQKENDPLYYRDRNVNISMHDDAGTGHRLAKWTNLTDAGEWASDCSYLGANTDIPVLRLADVHLMLAEAVLRGGTKATMNDALESVNEVRARAFGSDEGKISADELTLDFLCEERLREFYMECIRRTDLIRFGKYTSGYDWQWKGGNVNGGDVADKYVYLPIPETEYSVNPAMKEVNAEVGF